MKKTYQTVLLLIVILSFPTWAQEKHDPAETIQIDKIKIVKNWITWDLIVKNELEFKEGDLVRYGQIDTSITKIWNIGSFADVQYTINKTEAGNGIEIKALDAIKLYPLIVIDHSSEDDYHYQLGYGDENFLGSNTYLKIAWDKQPTGVAWDFNFKLPRQLMYKNATFQFGFIAGSEIKRYLDRETYRNTNNTVDSVVYVPLMFAPYKKTEIYGNIGNPWHLDYKYRFSPDLTFRYMHHEIDYGMLTPEMYDYNVQVPEYTYDMLSLWLNESVGTVNKKRHRRDGYIINGAYGINIGLNQQSPTFHSVSFNAEYHKIFSKLFQFSGWLRTGYTTAEAPYQHLKGSSDVLGIRNG